MNSIFIDCFGDLSDPRVERTKKHLLLDIIGLSLCGILSGAENWEEIADFGKAHDEWFSQFLTLPNGIPSHDTLSRVFSALDPEAFQERCMTWLRRIKPLLPEDVVAIDGKTLRGSKALTKCQKALHIVNAWSCENQVCLGQISVDDKSNEIPAVPELLKLLCLEGAIVTLDAMGAQTATTKAITDAGADYVIALKGNQGLLCEHTSEAFSLYDQGKSQAVIHDAEDEIDSLHGRLELRAIEVMDAAEITGLMDAHWSGLSSIARLSYTRIEGGHTIKEQRFYFSSLACSQPDRLLRSIRSHWAVENHLHWSLDVTFNEDRSRIRERNAAANFSWMRKFSLGLLKNESSFKASIRRKQRKACTDIQYLATIVKAN